MIFVYFLKITPVWTEKDDYLTSFVSSTRINKIESYKFIADKKTSLYSELIVRSKVEELIGIPSQQQKYVFNSDVKPYIKCQETLYFNISHSKSFLCCSISLDTDVGIDIEVIEDNPPIDMMECAFHMNEIQYVNKIPNSNLSFYKIWTRKEAYGKFQGYGLIYDLTNTNSLNLKQCHFKTYFFYNTVVTLCSDKLDRVIFKELSEEEVYHLFSR